MEKTAIYRVITQRPLAQGNWVCWVSIINSWYTSSAQPRAKQPVPLPQARLILLKGGAINRKGYQPRNSNPHWHNKDLSVPSLYSFSVLHSFGNQMT